MTLRIIAINKTCRQCKMPTMQVRQSVFGLKYESCSTCHATFGVMRVGVVKREICGFGCVCETCFPEINEV